MTSSTPETPSSENSSTQANSDILNRHQESDGRSILHEFWRTITGNIFQTSVVIVAMVFIFGLIVSIWRAESVISPLADAQYARGLITFLVAFAAILIAIILTLYAVLSGSDEHQEERFNRGKEVLTIFIGVLGTIVGFYFGSAPASEAVPLSASPVIVSSEQPVNGETISVMGFVSGGTEPYTYSILFSPPDIVGNVENGTSTDGVIQQRIPISASIISDTAVSLQVNVQDSTGERIEMGRKTIQVLAK